MREREAEIAEFFETETALVQCISRVINLSLIKTHFSRGIIGYEQKMSYVPASQAP
jgi:hypothetical protein